MRILAILAVFMLSGCAGVATRNAALYESQLAAHNATVQADAIAEASRAQSRDMARAEALKACTTDACRTQVIMASTLAQAIDGLASASKQRQAIPQPHYERDGAEKFATVANPFVPLVSQGIQGVFADRASARQERISISRDQTFETIVTEAIDSNGDVAETALENASPVYNVAGNLGNTDNSDHSTRNSHNQDNDQDNDTSIETGSGSAFGDGNEITNGNNNANAGNIGRDNRQGSPGPFTETNDGDCDGTGDCTPEGD